MTGRELQPQKPEEGNMQKTASELLIRVGEEKTPIHLTDSAVEAVQNEAAGKMVAALGGIWAIEKLIEGGASFAGLKIGTLTDLREHFQRALEMTDVLIDCRPLDDLDGDEEAT